MNVLPAVSESISAISDNDNLISFYGLHFINADSIKFNHQMIINSLVEGWFLTLISYKCNFTELSFIL